MRLLKRNLTDLLLLYLILDIAVRVAALPQAHPPSRSRRQTWTGAYAHDFSLLGCKPIILVYARETLASGNMVSLAPKISRYCTIQALLVASDQRTMTLRG